MEGLYKLEEYSGKLSNPKLFPIQGATITGIKDCPDIFMDGFMMDLLVPDKDRERLKEMVYNWVGKLEVDSLLEVAKKAIILLSEPEYIFDSMAGATYILTAPNIEPTGIQVKYYRYFRNRYKDCEFYTSGERMSVKSVKVGNKIVGLWMPVILTVGITEFFEEGKQ